MKLTPYIVSDLVVYTSRYSLVFFILNFIRVPFDIPIQFFCIILTLDGQLSKLSMLSNNSLE